ncbi:sensor histidine kinase [Mahella australiensis]|uniref:histidine kinase n=1 Tax=Mahella australiensis (strain DSM 15567 / CIP 107919 / 50-1 BON) TaxID=697281 RepID=F3ZVW4_MAHA5|nr:HAMP domain-containing sensor histidine kinase [Mahella australiensis]AEE95338.1 histidine kinase [Mahella australiensis 50-1 BON]
MLLEDFYEAIKIKDIRASAEYIAENIDSSDISSILEDISSRNELNVRVLDNDGMELYRTNQPYDRIIDRLSAADVRQLYWEAMRSGGLLFKRYEQAAPSRPQNGFMPSPPKNPMQTIVCVKVIQKAGDQTWTLLLGSSITPVDATVKTLRVQLIYATLILIAAAAFLAFILSRGIARPIIKINDSAKKLAKGNYDVSFNGTGYREIMELNETLNNAAKELAKTEKLRRELIANISHDLRTPLTMITGYGEIIRDLPDENTPENIRVIIDEANRLTRLVNDLMELSQLQSGTQQLQISRFNLTDVAKQTIERCAQFTKKDGYDITFSSDGDAWVEADELKISQVIYNLLGNALTYTGKDKTVAVSQQIKDGYVRISVKDTGDGISPEHIDNIWDRYYKVDKTHRRAALGTGLGLSIVKSIIQMHDGKCGVESKPGAGSTFWFELKLAEQ